MWSLNASMKHPTPKIFSIVEGNYYSQENYYNSGRKSYGGNTQFVEFGNNPNSLAKELQTLESSKCSMTSHVEERVAAIHRVSNASIKSDRIGPVLSDDLTSSSRIIEVPNTKAFQPTFTDIKKNKCLTGFTDGNRKCHPALKNCSWHPKEDDRIRQSTRITQQTTIPVSCVAMTTVIEKKPMRQIFSNKRYSTNTMTQIELKTFVDHILEKGLSIAQRTIKRELNLFQTRWEKRMNNNLDKLEHQLDEIGSLLSSITRSHRSPPQADRFSKQRKHYNF
jgi:hypothetical protein